MALTLAVVAPWLVALPTSWQLLVSLLSACTAAPLLHYCRGLQRWQGIVILAEADGEQFYLQGSEQSLMKVVLRLVYCSSLLLVVDVELAGRQPKPQCGPVNQRWWLLPDSLEDSDQRILRRCLRMADANRAPRAT